MKKIYLAVLILTLCGCQSTQDQKSKVTHITLTTPQLPTTLEDAVASSFRQEDNRKRDEFRHPISTLRFFGVTPNMSLLEISPGNGWYTEILAPFLKSSGHYLGAYPPGGDHHDDKKMATAVMEMVTRVSFDPSAQTEIVPAGSVDMVLTFRNVHNWMQKGAAENAFKLFFNALKPGGILGVVEHRANPKSKHDLKASSGYVRESEVVQFAKKAGFKLLAKSEINANPKDTKNYPEGVWTLPPTLKLGDKDREKYIAIGESDRMTLKFIKPDSAK